MAAPVTLIVVGLVIGFAAFCFIAVNMYRGVTNFESSDGFMTMFKRHVGGMIGIAFGGLLFTIGLILEIIHLVS